MTICLEMFPIALSNDDLPELGGETSLETCLHETRSAGYTGTETGGKFPRDVATLGEALQAHDLKLVSGCYFGTLLGREVEEEKDQIAAQLQPFLCRVPVSWCMAKPGNPLPGGPTQPHLESNYLSLGDVSTGGWRRTD